MSATAETEKATEFLNSQIANGTVHVRVKRAGVLRVLDGWEGMTLRAHSFTPGVRGPVAHCIDLRYPTDTPSGYQTWSIGADGYEVVP